MTADDLRVQQALDSAGYNTTPATCRGDLFDTLALILAADPVLNGDFVDTQRSILSNAELQTDVAELDLARAQHSFIKACPCGQRPDVGLGYISEAGEVLVVCMNHSDGAVTQGGKSLVAAIERWNADDWIQPGHVRKQFPL